MFRMTLKMEAICDSCPEVYREAHDGNEFGLGLIDESVQAVPDFLFKLEFEHGWAVVRESYAYHKLYCPKCRAMHNAERSQRIAA